jgi:pimeloyl-ACP methyl ester carboxylesterase
VEAAAQQPPPAIFADQPEPYRLRPAIAEQALPTVLRGAGGSDLPPPRVIEKLEMPVLILAWDTDPGHPLSTAEDLAGLLPDARLDVARRVADISLWPGRVRAFLREIG